MSMNEHLLNVYASRAAKGHTAAFLGYCEVSDAQATTRLTSGLWLVSVIFCYSVFMKHEGRTLHAVRHMLTVLTEHHCEKTSCQFDVVMLLSAWGMSLSAGDGHELRSKYNIVSLFQHDTLFGDQSRALFRDTTLLWLLVDVFHSKNCRVAGSGVRS